MASIDLNIIERNASSDYGWSAGSGKLTAEDLGQVVEQCTNNGNALNALPTPFARFYVFREAFRRVLEEKNNKSSDAGKKAGKAYEQLVSNCLDVFELLYNKKWHENHWGNTGRRIVIKEWNFDEDIKSLKQRVPILGGAVESYFKDDLDESRLFFVILEDNGKEYLLAASSPITGFVTPPDLDVINAGGNLKAFKESYAIFNERSLKRKADKGGCYFKDIRLFDQRPEDFKNYMYHTLFGSGGVNGKFLEIRNYIQAFNNDPAIKNTYSEDALETVKSSDQNELTVNGLSVRTKNDFDSVNYFADVILKVPYRIASDNFKTFEYDENQTGRDYDYLLPLSQQAIEAIGSADFKIKCKEKNNAIDITLVFKGAEFRKTYSKDYVGSSGKILQLSDAKFNFDLALFPNVLSADVKENNYFKVMLTACDENDSRKFTVDSIGLSFYRADNGKMFRIEEAGKGDESGLRPVVVRSCQDNESEYGSKYYEIFNSGFDAIFAKAKIDSYETSFALFPEWNRAKNADKSFDYAIDLGTSNTYISRREKGTSLQPQQLSMDKPIVSYLHDKIEPSQKNLVMRWEENAPDRFKAAYRTEFVPPFIDGKFYRFPIRTALCTTGDNTASEYSLFDNSNIAFFYEKTRAAAKQKIITDIKWSDNDNALRIFIRELLLIIKADILQENGTLSDTGIIWFRPLSFKDEERRSFEKIWKEEAGSILNLKSAEEQIKCYTESEAPYYYFNERGDYESIESVSIVDIGGGSTDFVYFKGGKPQIANSVHFGCDVLWSNGFDKMTDSKKNGIYNRYKASISFKDDDSLKELNKDMIDGKYSSTRDIINFWISNEQYTGISAKLRKDFPHVFAYHFTATIYYLASMLKANGLDYPRTVIFSGNGSRYIDQYLPADIEMLTGIVQKIFSKVFGKEEINNVQLILPEVRKESTCYGGLYYREQGTKIKEVVYYGNGRSETCNNVAELKAKFGDSLMREVLGEVEIMNGIYSDVLAELILKNGLNVELENCVKTVNHGMEDTIKTVFQNEVADKYQNQASYNDSLFFIPVTKAIFGLTNPVK
ncbi:MAG: hypothetical protein NC308_03185 [Clostridium sp.]|nr:hypothetical protein [Bacteroides sp.]MCM1197869.1 hypothetical protein [Clostridium sp.]